MAHRHRKARALDLLGAAQQMLRLRAAELRLCGVGKMGVDAREFYTPPAAESLFLKRSSLSPGVTLTRVETGVDLDLYFHFRLVCAAAASARMSGGEREMRVHGVGNSVRQRVSENERVLF